MFPPRGLASQSVTALRLIPLALLRMNYRLLRIPLQLIEQVAESRLEEHDRSRLTYEGFLVQCDRTAATHLGDTVAAERAEELRRHILATQMTVAWQQRRLEQRREAEAAGRTAQWEERQRHKERLRAAKVVPLFEHIDPPSP